MIGISIPRSCCDHAVLDKSINQGLFSCIELQGDSILDKNLIKLINNKNACLINSYDYIINSTILNSLEQPEIFQDDVISSIAVLMNEPLYENLQNITIDFGGMKESVQEKALKFLKKLYYTIYNSDKRICFPVMIPGIENKEGMLRSLCYKLMLDNFKICLNIYPHEIAQSDDLSSFINSFNFRINLLRICYDAASGNHLTTKLLEYIKNIFVKCDLCCPVIFVPNVNNAEALENEAENILNIIKSADSLQKYFY